MTPAADPGPMIRGILPPLVTPLTDQDTLDVAGLERLVEHVLAGGVHGVFLLGTTGEAPSLSHRLRRELVQRTCQLVAGRAPVLVGITDTAFAESLELAAAAADAGAAAVVVAPPYYFPIGQPELREYIEHLAPRLPLPVFLYNMPSHCKIEIGPEVLAAAVQISRVVGLKDSSGNMVYFHRALQLARQRPDFAVMVGPEQLLAEAVLLGGHGGVTGGANVFPERYVACYRAAAAGDLAGALRHHARVVAVGSALYTVGRHPSAIVKGLKCALALKGICDDFMAEPFHRFREPERQLLAQRLRELEAV